MGFKEAVWARARERAAAIVLPESEDTRMLRAAVEALEQGVAGKIFLLGNRESVMKNIPKSGTIRKNVEILDHDKADNLEEFAARYFELRKHKGIRMKEAARMVQDPLIYGAMMVKLGLVDGMVAGAVNTSRKVLSTVITVIGPKTGCRYISTCAVMVGFNPSFGSNGDFVFADVSLGAVMTPEQLAETAIQSAESARLFLGEPPAVAMLSFSTKGSARHEVVDRIIEATAIARKKRPDLLIDGELQADAAIVPEVAAAKCPDSPLSGRANVLIFPDLNAANIGVKLAERFGKAKCFGPILQGTAMPANDLSRGCTYEDIVNVIAITAVQSSEKEGRIEGGRPPGSRR
ncbi:MAG: phosphate acetyltransferase [Spirochaetes bacterium]|nr:phosphate acetyltransferase [Spirochaetota bacterium]